MLFCAYNPQVPSGRAAGSRADGIAKGAWVHPAERDATGLPAPASAGLFGLGPQVIGASGEASRVVMPMPSRSPAPRVKAPVEGCPASRAGPDLRRALHATVHPGRRACAGPSLAARLRHPTQRRADVCTTGAAGRPVERLERLGLSALRRAVSGPIDLAGRPSRPGSGAPSALRTAYAGGSTSADTGGRTGLRAAPCSATPAPPALRSRSAPAPATTRAIRQDAAPRADPPFGGAVSGRCQAAVRGHRAA